MTGIARAYGSIAHELDEDDEQRVREPIAAAEAAIERLNRIGLKPFPRPTPEQQAARRKREEHERQAARDAEGGTSRE